MNIRNTLNNIHFHIGSSDRNPLTVVPVVSVIPGVLCLAMRVSQTAVAALALMVAYPLSKLSNNPRIICLKKRLLENFMEGLLGSAMSIGLIIPLANIPVSFVSSYYNPNISNGADIQSDFIVKT